MRVLLISHTCQSRDEGHQKLVELGRFDDVELRVIVPDRWMHYGRPRAADPKTEGRYEYAPTPVRWSWLGPAQWYLHHYPSLASAMRSFRPDVIDLWEEPYGLVSAHAAWLRGRLLPEARIVSETEQNIFKRLPPPFEQFRRYTLGRADYAVGRSAEAVELLRRKGYNGPAEVVPNAVDASRFVPMDRDACRAQFGMRGFVVGYVGRLVDSKGIDEIVAAVRASPPDVQLLVAGEGDMRPMLEAFARESAMAGHVRRPGQLPSGRVAVRGGALADRLCNCGVEALADRLRDCGVEVHAVPLDPAVMETRRDLLGVASLFKLRRLAASLADASRIARQIRRIQPALVQANSLKANLIGGLAARLARVPLIWHVRRISDDFLPPHVVRLFRWLARWLPTHVVANSSITMETLCPTACERGHLSVIHDVTVIHDGIATGSRLRPATRGHRPIIGLIGGISPWKAQDVYIRAACRDAIVRPAMARASCCIVAFFVS